jgi:large subunit ribosomal protein L4
MSDIEIKVTSLSTGENKTTSTKLPENIFDVDKRSPGVLFEVINWYRTTARQGTRKVKRKAEVNTSKKKPWKQKGTGKARAGAANSPLWVGGGVAHGPQPKIYNPKVQKLVKGLAVKILLTDRLRSGDLFAVDSFEKADFSKTKNVKLALGNLNISDKNVLLVCNSDSSPLFLGARNIPNLKVTSATSVNSYDIARCKSIVIDEGALEVLKNRLAKS